jgi:mannose-1-phosphate guanylyltransferase
MNTVAVLMAGGAGTRFWPLSTPDLPKQFLTTLADKPLYVQAADRARLLAPWDRVLVMSHADYTGLVQQQTPDVSSANVIVEPVRRNTAAAIILAALIVDRRWPGATMIVMPSDHLITGTDGFRQTMAGAIERAQQGGLGTIGISPTYPATGFGYLRLGKRPEPFQAVRVEQFVEKPNRERAEQYLTSGEFLWNSGIFVWKADVLLAAAARHLPQVYQPLASLRDALDTASMTARVAAVFEKLESISIDYGVLEKAEDVWAVPAAFAWSDVGSWGAAADLLPADAAGNHVRGNVILESARGNVVVADTERPIVVAGISDCVVVQGPSGTLVCRKDMLDNLKALLDRIPPSKGSTGGGN